tara:strand:- start:1481 stop:1978 length:498 start_codon:yes stop_codon:yes gene_type:complete
MNKYILILAQFLILFLFWYLLSGKNMVLLLSLGALISILIVIYQYKLKILDDESLPIAILPRAIIYWIWLYKEILLSSLFVSKLILRFPMNISPKYFKLKSNQKTTMGFNIYANSITMTPGTISVLTNNNDKVIQIHAISEETKSALLSGVMDQKIKKLMGDKDV